MANFGRVTGYCNGLLAISAKAQSIILRVEPAGEYGYKWLQI